MKKQNSIDSTSKVSVVVDVIKLSDQQNCSKVSPILNNQSNGSKTSPATVMTTTSWSPTTVSSGNFFHR